MAIFDFIVGLALLLLLGVSVVGGSAFMALAMYALINELSKLGVNEPKEEKKK